MAGKRLASGSLFGIAIFTLVLFIGGMALAQTNNFRNPLSLVGLAPAPTRPPEPDGPAPRSGDPGRGNQSADRLQAGGNPGGGDTLVWSQVGGVLYNLWLVAAITDLVVIFQTIIKVIRQAIKRRHAQSTWPAPLGTG